MQQDINMRKSTKLYIWGNFIEVKISIKEIREKLIITGLTAGLAISTLFSGVPKAEAQTLPQYKQQEISSLINNASNSASNYENAALNMIYNSEYAKERIVNTINYKKHSYTDANANVKSSLVNWLAETQYNRGTRSGQIFGDLIQGYGQATVEANREEKNANQDVSATKKTVLLEAIRYNTEMQIRNTVDSSELPALNNLQYGNYTSVRQVKSSIKKILGRADSSIYRTISNSEEEMNGVMNGSIRNMLDILNYGKRETSIRAGSGNLHRHALRGAGTSDPVNAAPNAATSPSIRESTASALNPDYLPNSMIKEIKGAVLSEKQYEEKEIASLNSKEEEYKAMIGKGTQAAHSQKSVNAGQGQQNQESLKDIIYAAYGITRKGTGALIPKHTTNVAKQTKASAADAAEAEKIFSDVKSKVHTIISDTISQLNALYNTNISNTQLKAAISKIELNTVTKVTAAESVAKSNLRSIMPSTMPQKGTTGETAPRNSMQTAPARKVAR